MIIKRSFRQSVPKEINEALLLLMSTKIELQEPMSSPFFISLLHDRFESLPSSEKRFFWTTIDSQLKQMFPEYIFSRNWSSKRYSTICQKNFQDLTQDLKSHIINQIVMQEIHQLSQLNGMLHKIEIENPLISSKKIQSYGRQRYNKYISLRKIYNDKEQLKQLLFTKTFTKFKNTSGHLTNYSYDTVSSSSRKDITGSPSYQTFQLENTSYQTIYQENDHELLEKISQIITSAQQ